MEPENLHFNKFPGDAGLDSTLGESLHSIITELRSEITVSDFV